MSTENLPSVVTNDTNELMLATGQKQVFTENSAIPTLRVNYDDEDDEGNSIPRGQWTITVNGEAVYAPECNLRIMFSRMQYSHYDRDENVTKATSIYFKDFSDEVPDDAGGYKAGKVSKDEFEKLSPAEQAIQKQIKLSKVLFCLVSLEGTNAEGKEVTIEDQPCVFYARGTNFMPITKYLNDLTKKNILMQSVLTNVKLVRHRNDGVTFWVSDPSIKSEVQLSQNDNEIIKNFASVVEEENKEILEKHYAAKEDIPVDITPQDTNIFDDEIQELN